MTPIEIAKAIRQAYPGASGHALEAADAIEKMHAAITPFIDPIREVSRDETGAPTVHVEIFATELEALRAAARS
jgi:hypothetical protein